MLARLRKGFLLTPLECLVFGIAELWIILQGPRFYKQSVKRAVGFGRWPFHAFPRSADEKFLWRKCFDRDPVFTRLSDKLELRRWLAETGAELSMAPVLWSGQRPQDIPQALLTSDVIVKTNHNSGGNLSPDPTNLDRALIDDKLDRWLSGDYSRICGEWGYKNVPRQVFVEQRIGPKDVPIDDWKFYTFGSHIQRIVHIQNHADRRLGEVFAPTADGEFVRLDRPPRVCTGLLGGDRPASFDRAVALARQLGAGFDQMRVDLMEAEGKLWMGEMTIYNQTGYITDGGAFPDTPESQNWDLRRSWFLRTRPGGPFARFYARVLHKALDRAARLRNRPPE